MTFAVASANPGALALITADPVTPRVTLKLMTWVPAETGRLGGTVATLGLFDVRVNVVSLCPGAERVSVSVPSVAGLWMVRLAGDSVATRPTVTRPVAVAKPAA